MKKSFFLAAILIAAFFSGGRASAYYDVDPSVVELKIIPGGSKTGKIRIKNISKTPLAISAKVMDWRYDKPTGSKQFLPAGSTPNSLAKWITVAPVSFLVQPNRTQEVSYNLTVSSAATGGYYAVVVFSAGVPEAQKQQGVTINLALQMGTLILAEIEKTQDVRGTVTAFDVLGAPRKKQPVDVKARFKNTGNVRVEAKGRLSIIDAGGNSVGWTQFPPIKTLPGDEWEVATTWANGLESGRYRLIGTFELAPDKILIQEKEIQIP